MKPKRELLFLIFEILAAAGAVVWVVSDLGSQALLDLVAGSGLWRAAAAGVALLVLGLFNVWLPRGDAVDTTVPLVFAAAVLLHPLMAVLVLLLSRCATVALRPRGHTIETAVEPIARRSILICVIPVLMRLLGYSAAGSVASMSAASAGLVVAGAMLFIGLDSVLEQVNAAVRSKSPLLSLISGTLRLQGSMLAAEMSVAVLTVLMIPSLGDWGLIVAVALLLVMRQSFALLLEVRSAYTSTVEVLARSIEAYDPNRRGHAERVAAMVGTAGRAVGIQGRKLENVTYAALFHDVGRLGVDDDEDMSSARSAQVLADVGFLAGAIPILSVLDSCGQMDVSSDEDDLIGAYLVASFSAWDNQFHSLRAWPGEQDLAAAVGVRLYAATRRNVDKVIERVCREAGQETLLASKTQVSD